MPRQDKFTRKYAKALRELLRREILPSDGLPERIVVAAERRLKIKIPLALKKYYATAGRLSLNTEHNRLYAPGKLKIMGGKLVFMEENQLVVFWGMDRNALKREDPEVCQANNEKPVVWYPGGFPFSDWILRMWRWQRGLGPCL